jgi:hypothetical protein
LAYLQDFYGVINFGNQDEYEELLRSQRETLLLGTTAVAETQPAEAPPSTAGPDAQEQARPPLRTAVEELPRQAL